MARKSRKESVAVAKAPEKQRGYKLSLSVGGALWSECGNCEAMLEAADKKMYEVKQLCKERRKSDCECGSIYTG